MSHHSSRRAQRRSVRGLAGGALLALTCGLVVAPGLTAPASAVAAPLTEDFEAAPDAATGPEGWSVDRENTAGMREGWEGWTFHTLPEVTGTFGDGGRHGEFSRAEGTLAVVQSDGNRPASGTFDSALWAPDYGLDEGAEAVRIAFDSHYRQGQNPPGRLVASFDGGDPVVVESFSRDRLNEAAEFTVDVPEGAQSVRFGWEYLESSNNWYWMIDNVEIAEASPADVTPEVTSGAKPVVAPGGTTTIGLSGLRAGQQVVAELGEEAAPVSGIPAVGRDGTVSFDVAIPEGQGPGTLPLVIRGEGVTPVTVEITVLAAAAEDVTTTEPQLWWDGFEGAESEWESSGETDWELMDRAGSNDAYGTDRRHTFTRASGTMAVAESKNAAFDGALESAPVAVEAGDELELRFDSHYLRRGSGEQSGVVSAVFDSGERTVLYELGEEDEESAQPRLPFTVPDGAGSVGFSFSFAASAGSGSWRIDDVEAVRPLAPLAEGAEPTAVLDVFSDVQGADARLSDQVLPGLAGTGPVADTILSNGDQTGQGTETQYDSYLAAFDRGAGDRYGTRVSTIGNHEFFGSDGSEAYIERFVDRLDMSDLGAEGGDPAHRGLWGEVLVDDELPLLWIGSEFHDYPSQTGSGPFVELSDAQFEWLRDRLAHWTAEGKPVLLASHHVFNDSVSGTYARFYQGDFGDDTARIEALLAQHSNVTVLTSHTHWSPELNDWSVEQRFDPAAQHGPTIVNTAAVTTQYGPSGDWDETGIGGADPVGLKVALFEDRLRVTAYYFGAGGEADEVKHIDVAVPTDGDGTGEPGEGPGDEDGGSGGDGDPGQDGGGGQDGGSPGGSGGAGKSDVSGGSDQSAGAGAEASRDPLATTGWSAGGLAAAGIVAALALLGGAVILARRLRA